MAARFYLYQKGRFKKFSYIVERTWMSQAPMAAALHGKVLLCWIQGQQLFQTQGQLPVRWGGKNKNPSCAGI